MPLALIIEQCSCSRIAGAQTTTSCERRRSRFFSHREGDITSGRTTPRRAASTATRRHHVSETRRITPNTWGDTRLRVTLRRPSERPQGSWLFPTLTTVNPLHREPLYPITRLIFPRIYLRGNPAPRIFARSFNYLSLCHSNASRCE